MNYLDKPAHCLHAALAHAAYEGFPQHEYQDRDWSSPDRNARVKKSRKHSDYDLTVAAMFPQTWGSTALGFGGIGGQAVTSAYVIVIESQLGYGYCVYFGGRFAYRIEQPNEQFFLDIQQKRMHDVAGANAVYSRELVNA